MKKFLLMFMACLLIAFATQSQTSTKTKSKSTTDTTLCLPLEIQQNLFTDAKQKKVLQAEVTLLHQDISTLNQLIIVKDRRIAELESIVSEYKGKDSLNIGIVQTYQQELKVLREEKQLYVDKLAATEKALKKAKRKTTFVAVVGTLVAGGLTYLLLTK